MKKVYPTWLRESHVVMFLLLALTFLIVIAVLVSISDASTTAPRTLERKVVEDLGRVASVRGFVMDVKLLGTEDNMFTNVRIRMYGVPQDVSLLFCGYLGDNIAFGPMKLQFLMSSPRSYQGIGCFTLISAEKVDPNGGDK